MEINCIIDAGVNGFLDNIPVNKIQQFEVGKFHTSFHYDSPRTQLTNWVDFLAHLKTNEPEIQATIVKEGVISKDLEAKLKQVTGDFVKSFL